MLLKYMYSCICIDWFERISACHFFGVYFLVFNFLYGRQQTRGCSSLDLYGCRKNYCVVHVHNIAV